MKSVKTSTMKALLLLVLLACAAALTRPAFEHSATAQQPEQSPAAGSVEPLRSVESVFQSEEAFINGGGRCQTKNPTQEMIERSNRAVEAYRAAHEDKNTTPQGGAEQGQIPRTITIQV
jgi:hypothetical protein